LGGSGDSMPHREMGKELPDLFGPPISGMTFVMKQDEALDPLHIGFFGTDTITLFKNSIIKSK
jgi:hypothetical protein